MKAVTVLVVLIALGAVAVVIVFLFRGSTPTSVYTPIPGDQVVFISCPDCDARGQAVPLWSFPEAGTVVCYLGKHVYHEAAVRGEMVLTSGKRMYYVQHPNCTGWLPESQTRKAPYPYPLPPTQPDHFPSRRFP